MSRPEDSSFLDVLLGGDHETDEPAPAAATTVVPTPAAASPTARATTETAPTTEAVRPETPAAASVAVPAAARSTVRPEATLPVPDDPTVVARLQEQAGIEVEHATIPGFLEGLLGIVAPEPAEISAEQLVAAYGSAAAGQAAAAPEAEAATEAETETSKPGKDAPRRRGLRRHRVSHETAPEVDTNTDDGQPTATELDTVGDDSTVDEADAPEDEAAFGDEDVAGMLPPLSFDRHAPEPPTPDLPPSDAPSDAVAASAPDEATDEPHVADATEATPTPTLAPAPLAPTASDVPAPAPAPAEALVASLTSFDTGRRRTALVSLMDQPLTRSLVEAAALSLSDPATDLRLLALQVLERAPELTPDDALRSSLVDPDEGIRQRATTLLGRTGRLALVPTLSERLADETDHDVVAAGVVALADLFRVATAPSDDVLAATYRAIGHIPTVIVPQIERELTRLAQTLDGGHTRHHLGHPEETVRTGAAVLALQSGSDETVGVLGRLLTDDSARIRQLAMTAVARTQPASETADTASPDRSAATHDTDTEPTPPRHVYNEVEGALFPGLVEALADPKPEIREQAGRALALVDRARLETWVAERAAEVSPDQLVRLVSACDTLGLDDAVPHLAAAAIRIPSGQSRRQVGAALHDLPAAHQLAAVWRDSSDPAQRGDAIRLGSLLTPEDSAAIVAGLEDPNATVRLAAIAVATTTQVDEELAAALLHLVEVDPSSRVRIAAVESFRTTASAQRVAAARATARATAAEVRRAGLTLLDPGPSEEFHLLAAGLRDDDAEVVEQAATILVQSRTSEAVALLWSELRVATETSRRTILDILRAQDPQMLARLARRAVDSSDPVERVAGLSALATFGDHEVRDQLVASLGDPSIEVRLESLRALAAEPGTVPVSTLVAVLRDAEPRVRAAAVDVIASAEDDQALPSLLDAFDDPSELVREAAHQALGRLRSPAATELLLGVLEQPAHRAAAVAALAAVGASSTGRLVTAMEAATGDIRAAIREALLRADVVGRTLPGLTSPAPALRRAALGVLRTVRPDGITDAVVARLHDPIAEVRIDAARLLGELGDPGAAPALQRAFVDDPDMEVVAEVETAYRRLTTPEER